MREAYCYHCMRPVEPGLKCPSCGQEPGAKEPLPFVLPPGATIHAGKYLIGEVLGQGGFGITYVGLDRVLQLKVAIKEFFPMNFATRKGTAVFFPANSVQYDAERGREGFIREARKMAKADTIPGVVQVKDIFYENNTSYIVMGFIEGETLGKRVEREGLFDWKKARATLLPAMRTLCEAHQCGLIHRDISPDNLMLDRRGKIWILDLGAAKDLETPVSSYSQASQLVVRRGFSPPEQSMTNGNIGPWTDVYAMCATIYYCMSGQLVLDSTERLFQDRFQIVPWIPAAVAAVLTRGLALRPDDRISSMEDLIAALEAASASEQGTVGQLEHGEVSAVTRNASAYPQHQDMAGQYSGFVGQRQGRSVPYAAADVKWQDAGRQYTGFSGQRQGRSVPRAGQDAQRQDAGKPYTSVGGHQEWSTPHAGNTQRQRQSMAYSGLGSQQRQSNVPSGRRKERRNPSMPLSGKRVQSDDKKADSVFDGLKYDAAEDGLRITGCQSDQVNITIPDMIDGVPVTAVGSYAFNGLAALERVTLGENVKRIEHAAFADCRNLTYLELPDGVTEIAKYAFSSCGKLSEVRFGGSFAQWNSIAMGEGNKSLTRCAVQFNAG